MDEITLQINKFLPFTKVEGPGNRACVWLQGCNIHCPGCAVPWMWPMDGGKSHNVQELAEKILENNKIEGVTFSGGEPFLQAKSILHLCKILKEKSDLSILIYTGYTLEYILESNNSDWNSLISITDILIDGPYLKENPSNKPLIGSLNQKIHYLSPRYKNLNKILVNESNKIEIHIASDSRIQLNGNIDNLFIKEILPHMVLKKK